MAASTESPIHEIDSLVIGAGPSGLACALRSAICGDRVLLLEAHGKEGGLNSHYTRPWSKIIAPNLHNSPVDREKILFDVGLHALTNLPSSVAAASTPFDRLMRLLRLSKNNYQWHLLDRCRVHTAELSIDFNGSLMDWATQLKEIFPQEQRGIEAFLQYVEQVDEFALMGQNHPRTREQLGHFVRDPQLVSHLLFPVLTYGSPWALDMDWPWFLCLLKSMFVQRMGRPAGGIRAWWAPLMKSLEQRGVQLQFRQPVDSIIPIAQGDYRYLVTTAKGQQYRAKRLFSSAGLINTRKLLPPVMASETLPAAPAPAMTVCETILFWALPADFNREEWSLPGLFFWSRAGAESYQAPQELIDLEMIILCAPLQFDRQSRQQVCYPSDGGELFSVRLTTRASAAWIELFEQNPELYREKKEQLALALKQWLCDQFPVFRTCQLLGQDVFTPKTIKHYCRHSRGELYGGHEKIPGGLLDPNHLPEFYIIGADQGPAGLIGAMMSGAVMASHPHLSNFSQT